MTKQQKSGRLESGCVITPREIATVSGVPVTIPEADRLVHLQFRRFAGCPVCDLHLRLVMRRHDEIVAASIREVIVFHSTAEEIVRYAGGLPFAVIADPDKRLYREFGVESSLQALLDPRSWLPILRAIVRGLRTVLRKQPVPGASVHGGRLGLPADFLIASDGRVLASKYGSYIYDQWSVDEILALRKTHSPAPA